MNYNFKKFIKIGLYICLVVFLLMLLFTGINLIVLFKERNWFDLISNLITNVSASVSISIIFMVLYNKYLWKYKFFRDLHSIPILQEYYKGYLESSWDDFKKKYSYEIRIKQTFLSTIVILKSGESSSFSVTADLIIKDDKKYLIYTYRNEPNAQFKSRSSIHYGTAMLCIDDVHKIEGNYFTDRKTIGHMSLEGIR